MSFAEMESSNSSQPGSVLAFFGGEGFLGVCQSRWVSSESSGDRPDDVGDVVGAWPWGGSCPGGGSQENQQSSQPFSEKRKWKWWQTEQWALPLVNMWRDGKNPGEGRKCKTEWNLWWGWQSSTAVKLMWWQSKAKACAKCLVKYCVYIYILYCVCIYLSICLSVCLSICYLSVYLSMYLSNLL